MASKYYSGKEEEWEMASGKWQVCVDFTDLNKACPKGPFPMPKIDQQEEPGT